MGAVVTTTNIVVIVYVLCAGLPYGHFSNLTPFAPYGLRGIFAASSIVFFSFVGFDGAITAAEEAAEESVRTATLADRDVGAGRNDVEQGEAVSVSPKMVTLEANETASTRMADLRI